MNTFKKTMGLLLMALVVSCENKNEEAIESAAAESSANAMVSS
jgi:hypothetical protein